MGRAFVECRDALSTIESVLGSVDSVRRTVSLRCNEESTDYRRASLAGPPHLIKHRLQFVDKIADVLEFAIDAGEADECHLVELP